MSTFTILEQVYLGTHKEDIYFVATETVKNGESSRLYSKHNYSIDHSHCYKNREGWIKAINKLKREGAKEHPSHWY